MQLISGNALKQFGICHFSILHWVLVLTGASASCFHTEHVGCALPPQQACAPDQALLSVRRVLAQAQAHAASFFRYAEASNPEATGNDSDHCHESWTSRPYINTAVLAPDPDPDGENKSSLIEGFQMEDASPRMSSFFKLEKEEPNASFGKQLDATNDVDPFLFHTSQDDRPTNANDPLHHITFDLVRMGEEFKMVNGILHFKSAYYGTVMMGTPRRPFTVVFDTGSGHLILPSMYCHTDACKAHRRYKRSASFTADDIDGNGQPVVAGRPRDQVSISFGTGEVTGVFVEDEMCFGRSGAALPSGDALLEEYGGGGPMDPSSENCVRMRFIAATDMSEDPFKDFVFDGVLGLGLNSLSQTPAFNFLDVASGLLRERGSEHSKTFGIFLATHDQETSQITMGGWAEHHTHEAVQWSPVLEPEHGHWLLEIKALRVNGETLPYCNEGCKAVVDSGTSLLSVPTPFFPEIYGLLKHSASLEGECISQSPQLEVELDGFTMTLDGGDFAHLEERRPTSKPAWGSSGEDNTSRQDMFCKPVLMVMDLPEPIGPKLFILGEPVLKKYYTIYDAEQQRIGFSRARHAPQPQANHDAEMDDDDSWWLEAEEEIAAEEAAAEEAAARAAEEAEAEKERLRYEAELAQELETRRAEQSDEGLDDIGNPTECQLITIGASDVITKQVDFPYWHLKCPEHVDRDNWKNNDDYADTFEVLQEDSTLYVQRTDTDTGGWGMELMIECCEAVESVHDDSEPELNSNMVEPEQPTDCETLIIGPSDANTKTSYVSEPRFVCPQNIDRYSWVNDYDRYDDTFAVTQQGQEVVVQRTDVFAGWGMHLAIQCCMQQEPAEEDELRNRVADADQEATETEFPANQEHLILEAVEMKLKGRAESANRPKTLRGNVAELLQVPGQADAAWRDRVRELMGGAAPPVEHESLSQQMEKLLR